MSEILKSARVEKQAVNEEELALISAQALREVKAEEIYSFKIAACDNQIDRDQERFTEATLDKFAELFVGRPVLRDHRWSSTSQIARIYAGGTVQEGSVKRLILRAYMPRNQNTQPVVDAIELGILREASVGVMVERMICSVCGGNYMECSHRRGVTYEEKRCHVDLDGAKDAYELSMVAVPSQPEAGVVKRYEAKETKTAGGETGDDDGSILRMAQAMQEMEEKRYGGM